MLVLPDVGSTMVPPAFRLPSRSAASIIARPIRSLIDPPGLARSDLIHTSASGNSRETRICGVLPMVSRIELAFIVAVHLLDNRTGDRAARTDAASRHILPKTFRSRAPGPEGVVTWGEETVIKALCRAGGTH